MSNAYGRPSTMRDYINFKVSQNEPFDVLYFTPSLTVQADTTDRSALILPELLYTGIKNIELRLRLQASVGSRLTEYGEKQADDRIEFRMRHFF